MRVMMQIIGLGLLNGSRTFAVPALLSRRLAHSGHELSGAARLLSRSGFSRALQVMALLELLGDKIPGIPARIEPPGLVGRATTGVWVGAALSEAWNRPRLGGAAIGALAAVLGAFAGYYARRELTAEHGPALPDLLVALAEDALVLGGGSALVDLPPPDVSAR